MGERRFPKTINGSRKKRIAAGAGLQIQDVNRLLKQHTQMERMMNCEQVRGQLTAYLDGELTGRQRARIGAHDGPHEGPYEGPDAQDRSPSRTSRPTGRAAAAGRPAALQTFRATLNSRHAR